MRRRDFLRTLAAVFCAGAPAYAPRPSSALQPEALALPAVLDREQSRRFRAWVLRIVRAQFQQGPTPRWTHRDCAGLVRFAVAEALRKHDEAWLRANGLAGAERASLPPEVNLRAEQHKLRHSWRLADGSTSAYVGALEMIQQNSVFVGKDLNLAQPADLLFFDQGDDQHLMLWMGDHIAYHTGANVPGDHGLRAVSVRELRSWKDTRWQPTTENTNFVGVFRLAFLAR